MASYIAWNMTTAERLRCKTEASARSKINREAGRDDEWILFRVADKPDEDGHITQIAAGLGRTA